MTSLINKLLGRDDEEHSHSHSHSHKTDGKCESGTCSTSVTGGEKCGTKQECGKNSETRTVQHEGVNIKSTISTEGSSSVSMVNQQKLTDLVTKLGSTHSQIDEYARNQSEKIDEAIQQEIDAVVGRTRREQDDLLRRANERTQDIDNEYRARLQAMVEEIDAAKAKRIAEIETELNNQQTGILQSARNEIDQLNQKAAKLKINVLESAQAKAASDAKTITAEAANLGQTATVHQASGTTTIKTEVSAATSTKETGGAAHTGTASGTVHTATAGGAKKVSETSTVETSTRQSHDSKQ